MCSLFGLVDYDKKLTTRQKNKILNTLARECEVRGTDATGIAYNFAGRMRIYKRPLPAHKLWLHVPNSVHVVMGHTRMTTQGSEKRNQNNHPFAGKADGKSFALAHNGVLWNDKTLKLTEQLPDTSVETDSYVAVQLIEKQNALDFDSLQAMAEKVEGSFVFTVLDNEDSIWFVVGDNPLCLFYYEGFLLYASTEEILCRVKSAGCFVQNQQFRLVGQSHSKCQFHFHAFGKIFNFFILRQFKFFEMLAIKRPIPAGINSRHELPDFFCREDVREMIFIENHAELIFNFDFI